MSSPGEQDRCKANEPDTGARDAPARSPEAITGSNFSLVPLWSDVLRAGTSRAPFLNLWRKAHSARKGDCHHTQLSYEL